MRLYLVMAGAVIVTASAVFLSWRIAAMRYRAKHRFGWTDQDQIEIIDKPGVE